MTGVVDLAVPAIPDASVQDAQDVQKAREREQEIRDQTPGRLACALTLGFFLCLGYLLICGKPTTGGDALLVMLGALSSGFTQILNYYFGSSSSSKDKTNGMLAAIKGK